MRPHIYWTALCVLTASLVGCWHPARTRFANEFDCPRDQIEVEDLGARSYRVSGCSRSVTYVCAANFCAMDAVHESGPDESPAETEDVRRHPAVVNSRIRLERGVVDGTRAVRLRFDHVFDVSLVYAPAVDASHVRARVRGPTPAQTAQCGSLRLDVPDGSLLALTPRGEPGTFQAMVQSMLALSGRVERLTLSSCGTDAPLTSQEKTTFFRFLREVRELRDTMATTAAATAPPAPPVEAPAASAPDVRGWLEAHRDLILGCTDADLVVVRVERAQDGSADISLRRPFAGTPEEACVRDGLGDPPPGAAGVTVHAVRAE